MNDQPSPAPIRPLAGLKVLEFTHMVMGPTCGMVLADLGAEVIKLEPIGGENTRRLVGAGAGFFPMFNRNKKSVEINLHHPDGAEVARRLAASADVVIENFKPGTLAKYGLDYPSLAAANPRLIYVSHKGFLPGPYEHRTALDEVVQMMGGLAYMTGRPGDPLRAGSSVNDIMGGLFGAIGVLAALHQRDKAAGGTGSGQAVQSALFENNVLLVAQHMLQAAVTGQNPAPMPSRISAWGLYDVFTVAEGAQVFLAAVSDTQWALLCGEFGWPDLAGDARLASNNHRVRARDWLLPLLRERFAPFGAADLMQRFERIGLPYAPITRPQDLFGDPHLLATGGLAPVTLPADASGAGHPVATRMPLLPITLDGQRLPLRSPPPSVGAHTRTLLQQLGYADADIDALAAAGVVGLPAAAPADQRAEAPPPA